MGRDTKKKPKNTYPLVGHLPKKITLTILVREDVSQFSEKIECHQRTTLLTPSLIRKSTNITETSHDYIRNMHQTQRCRNTQSISEFHKNTPTQMQFSQLSLEIPMFENALKPYSIVWDQVKGNRLDTVNRIRPWSQGPSVKKPHSQPQQGDQRRMIPLSITKEGLQKFKTKTQND